MSRASLDSQDLQAQRCRFIRRGETQGPISVKLFFSFLSGIQRCAGPNRWARSSRKTGERVSRYHGDGINNNPVVFINCQGYKGIKGVQGRGGETGPVVRASGSTRATRWRWVPKREFLTLTFGTAGWLWTWGRRRSFRLLWGHGEFAGQLLRAGLTEGLLTLELRTRWRLNSLLRKQGEVGLPGHPGELGELGLKVNLLSSAELLIKYPPTTVSPEPAAYHSALRATWAWTDPEEEWGVLGSL